MTDKPVLSEGEIKDLCKQGCGLNCCNTSDCAMLKAIDRVIRAHVVKALDGIDINIDESYTDIIDKMRIKRLIQKAKEAYL